MNRPKTYTIAVILQLLLSVSNIPGSISFLALGNAGSAAAGPPFAVELVIFTTAVLGLPAAYGIWHNQRWGIILCIVLGILTGLVCLPGLLFAPSLFGQLASAADVILVVAIIVLLLWPRPALASAPGTRA